MSRRNRQLLLCGILIALNLCFIWGNSLMPAQVSQAFSDEVKSLLETVIPGNNGRESDGSLLRKLAHFTEFTALGLLLQWQFLLLRKKGWHPLLWGVMVACIDETIQFFVPGRGPGILDVGIDACGLLMGMLLLRIGYVLMRRNQQRPYGGK